MKSKHLFSAVGALMVALVLVVGASQIGQNPPWGWTLTGADFRCDSSGSPTGCQTGGGRTFQMVLTGRTYGVYAELPFDAASTECVYAERALPRLYPGGNVSLTPEYFSNSPAAGNVVWTFGWKKESQGGAHDATWTTTTITSAVSAQDVIQDKDYTIANFPSSPGTVQMKFCRTGGAAGDTATGDAYLRNLFIEPTY